MVDVMQGGRLQNMYDQIDDYLEGKAICIEAQEKLEQRYGQTEHKRQTPVTLYCNWDT